jgi:uncharacterized integral membrane protein
VLYLILVLLLLVGGSLTWITIHNLSSPQALDVFIWRTPVLPVGLLVLFAFLLGALLLYIVSILSALADYAEIRQLRKRVAELEHAREIPVQEPPPPPTTSGPTAPMPGLPSGPLEE